MEPSRGAAQKRAARVGFFADLSLLIARTARQYSRSRRRPTQPSATARCAVRWSRENCVMNANRLSTSKQDDMTGYSRSTRSRRVWQLCIAGSTLLALAQHSKAVAGVGSQGVTSQGVTARRMVALDVSTPWLQGPRLVAWRSDDTALEITQFAGDTVVASERDTATGSAESVVLHPLALVGLHWSESRCTKDKCERRMYRIRRVNRDTSKNTMPHHSANHDVWLYNIEWTGQGNPRPGDWTDLCSSSHSKSGLFVTGQWAADGRWHARGYTFSCTDGVIAKCVRGWGYKPWKSIHSTHHGPVNLRSLHVACTRAARAEYCGDGVSYTRTGTFVDIFDIYGFNVRRRNTGFGEESVFSTRRAEFVRHSRIPGHEPTCAHVLSTEPTEPPLIYVWSHTRTDAR